MYEKFKQLLEERGITAYRVAKDTGIPQTTFCDWKSGKSEPKTDKLWKIADYFGVTIAYFFDEYEEKAICMKDKIKILSNQIYEDIQSLRESGNYDVEKRLGVEIMALNAMCNATKTIE